MRQSIYGKIARLRAAIIFYKRMLAQRERNNYNSRRSSSRVMRRKINVMFMYDYEKCMNIADVNEDLIDECGRELGN